MFAEGHLAPPGGWAGAADHSEPLHLIHALYDHGHARWGCHDRDEFFPDGFAYVGVDEPGCLIRVDLAGGDDRVAAVLFRWSGQGACAGELRRLIERLGGECGLAVTPVRHPTWQEWAERGHKVDAVKAHHKAATGGALVDSPRAVEAYMAQGQGERQDAEPDGVLSRGDFGPS